MRVSVWVPPVSYAFRSIHVVFISVSVHCGHDSPFTPHEFDVLSHEQRCTQPRARAQTLSTRLLGRSIFAVWSIWFHRHGVGELIVMALASQSFCGSKAASSGLLALSTSIFRHGFLRL